MSSYYIQTNEGPKGPYTAEVIREGVRQGRIPANARLQDSLTGQPILAAAVASDPAPQISGPAEPARPANPYAPRPAYPQYGPPPAYPQYGPPPAAYPAQPYGGQSYVPYAVPKPTSGLAVASLVLSLVTLVSCLPTCIGGIICGGLALKDTGPEGSKQGRGLALWGLWLGIIFTAIYLAFIGLFAFAIAMEK